ncbi:TOBE domain-containing protein [Burkholderia vietnamiensis]|nr:hypothetical protein BvRS1_07930 [Burkholderia vietnamiensis]
MTLALAGGGMLAAVFTNASAGALRLEAGRRAIALFKASSVILAVTG